LEVDPFAGSFGCDADLAGNTEVFLGAFPLMRVHTTVDFTCGVAPCLQMFAQVVQRIAVLSEDKKLAAAVL
jgi:hypothetical protein